MDKKLEADAPSKNIKGATYTGRNLTVSTVNNTKYTDWDLLHTEAGFRLWRR